MHKLSCPHCQRTFEKPTLDRCRAALSMHIGRKHTRTIPTATKEIMARNIAAANAAKQRQREQLAAIEPAHSVTDSKPKPTDATIWTPKPKRTYTKRPKPAQPEPITAEVKINFCPNCGFDIRKTAIGMVLGNANHSSI